MNLADEVNSILDNYQNSLCIECQKCCLNTVIQQLNKASLCGISSVEITEIHPSCYDFVVNNLPNGISVNDHTFTVNDVNTHESLFLASILNGLVTDLIAHIKAYANLGITVFDRDICVPNYEFTDIEKAEIIDYLSEHFIETGFTITNHDNHIHVVKN